MSAFAHFLNLRQENNRCGPTRRCSQPLSASLLGLRGPATGIDHQLSPVTRSGWLSLTLAFMKQHIQHTIIATAALAATALGGNVPSNSSMHSLAMKAATGDRTAIDSLQEIYVEAKAETYRNDDQSSRTELSQKFRYLFDEIGKSVKQPGESDPAFVALLYASAKDKLTGFAVDGLGTAAAKGHQPSLEVLLNHHDYGILLSSTVFALQKPAEARNQAAIEFLIAVVDDEKKKPLWSAATKGLRVAALEGNSDAQVAIQRYADYKANK